MVKLKILKNWGLSLIMILISLELSPYVIGRFFLQQSFSRKEIRKEIIISKESISIDTIENKPTEGYLGDHILHPYLGFVSIPHSNYNEFNLPGIDPLTKKSADVLNIVIMGGSVAKDIYSYTGERIIKNLKKLAPFKDKKINLVVYALGGYKQPQQLIALNYFLALGAEYDIVINIDGFNEIVLPYADNLPHHVFPSYPRHWNIYSRKKLDSKVLLIMGKQAVLKDKMIISKKNISNSILQYSNLSLFLWKLKTLKNQATFAALENDLRKALDNSETDYQSTGIYTTVSDTLAFFREQADFWMRSSFQVEALSNSGGFEYFHFLQPNQYDEGSKKLTNEEMQIAYESGPFDYKDAARTGYPMLRRNGVILKDKGVNFIDLTSLFKNENRTVYNDKCCHFNQLGYDIMADRIASEIENQVSNHNTN
jgi:hypothetical protein